MSLFIKKHPSLELWTININRVKIGTIRKRERHYWVHMPEMVIGGKRYPEKNFYPVDLPSAYAVASNAWRNERADLKFDIIKESLPFEKERPPKSTHRPRQKSRIKTYGDFTRIKKGRKK